jgi:hypothetical protein
MAEADRIAEFKEVAELIPDDPVVRFGLAGAYQGLEVAARTGDLQTGKEIAGRE